MIATEDQIAGWKHAYRVLDVPESASPKAIKSAYRKLVKRWHPDRYRPGTDECAEATRMTELLNAAYAAIGEAPLAGRFEVQHVYSPARSASHAPDPPIPQKFDWFGYWVRFVCGAILGAVAGLAFILRGFTIEDSAHPVFTAVAIIGVLMLLFGLASGAEGDKFWSFRG